jgi:alanine dehydrogenase
MLQVGVPKEIKSLEKRVGLVPFAVRALHGMGINVLVERQAGAGSGYSDVDYELAGARMVTSAADVYGEADLIQKVKEPLQPEYSLLRPGQILFGFLHLATPENQNLVEALLRAGVTAIGYETLEKDGKLPLLAPMSEIAGSLAGAYGAVLKSLAVSPAVLDSEIILRALEDASARYPEFKGLPSAGRTVIFGGGVAGFKALEATLRLKGQAAVIEKDPQRRLFLKSHTPAVFSPEDDFREVLEQADVLVGAVHARGARAFQVMDEKTLETVSLGKKKIILDIAIDQGGNFPYSRSSPYHAPVYFDRWGNLRFCVPNMPSLCGRGASEALSNVTLPYTMALALDPKQAFQQYPELAGAINIEKGIRF